MNNLFYLIRYLEYKIHILNAKKSNLEFIIHHLEDSIQDINPYNIELILKLLDFKDELFLINYIILDNTKHLSYLNALTSLS
jgi:hypothetical protein